jgi:hypothetical protein
MDLTDRLSPQQVRDTSRSKQLCASDCIPYRAAVASEAEEGRLLPTPHTHRSTPRGQPHRRRALRAGVFLRRPDRLADRRGTDLHRPRPPASIRDDHYTDYMIRYQARTYNLFDDRPRTRRNGNACAAAACAVRPPPIT